MNDYRSKKVKAGTAFYRIENVACNRYGGDVYRHATIEVGIATDFSTTRSITIRAQANGDDPRYYAMSIEVMIKLDFATEEVLALARKVRRAIDAVRVEATPERDIEIQRCDIAALRAALKKIKAVEAVYDQRISEMVPVKDVLPREWGSWRDDWQAMGNTDGCTWAAIARDKDEARAMMVLNLKERTTGRYYGEPDGYYDRWIAAGMPVTRLTGGYEPPTIFTWEQLYPAKPTPHETLTPIPSPTSH